MLFLYYRIFLLSFGIQHSLGKPHLSSSLTFYVVKGFECATEYIKVVTERLGVTGFLRYAMVSPLTGRRFSLRSLPPPRTPP